MIRKMTLSTTALLVATAFAASAQEMTVPGPATLSNDGTLEISGAGFEANASVLLLFTTADGVVAEIGYALDAEPVADADGNWSAVWSYGRFVKKKLVVAGEYTLTATNDVFSELADVSIAFAE